MANAVPFIATLNIAQDGLALHEAEFVKRFQAELEDVAEAALAWYRAQTAA